jgi:excisionase family DNA binding protein
MVSVSRSISTSSSSHPDLVEAEAAAEFLNVSLPFLMQRLESGDLPYQQVGTQVWVLRSDLMDYRDRLDAMASEAMDELVAVSQDLSLYD